MLRVSKRPFTNGRRLCVRFVTCLLLALAATGHIPALAGAEPSGWHGVRWGMSKHEVVKVFPKAKFEADGVTLNGPVRIISGVQAGVVLFGFRDGKLQSIKFFPMTDDPNMQSSPRFSASDMATLGDYIKDKYGKASAQGHSGGRIIQMSWGFAHSRIDLLETSLTLSTR